MKKRVLPILLICAVMLLGACASAQKSESAHMDAYVMDAAPAEAPMAGNGAYGMAEPAAASTASTPSSQQTAGKVDVQKIIYNADMQLEVDDPAAALRALSDKTAALGGYVAGSNTSNDDHGASRCSATLKVPADKLEELVQAAQAAGKVEHYQLSSDDVSQAYYDVAARLKNARAEEASLTAILEKCETVEDVLAVRESLSRVRADIESYQGQINLWDNLVAYATLELHISRTPMTAVQEENELISLWKASDVWKRISRGFVNSARFTVNAIGAIGIALAVLAIPAAVLFLCVGLPLIAHKKKKKRLALENPGSAPEKLTARQKRLARKAQKAGEKAWEQGPAAGSEQKNEQKE